MIYHILHVGLLDLEGQRYKMQVRKVIVVKPWIYGHWGFRCIHIIIRIFHLWANHSTKSNTNVRNNSLNLM
jgi:hypothetical protein